MADKLKELLGLLEERLVEHDESRKEVQEEMQELRSKVEEGADSLEEKMDGIIGKELEEKEERILGLVEKLNVEEGDANDLIEQAREELSNEWKYEIKYCDFAESFADSYELDVSSVDVEKEFDFFDNTESIVNYLQEHLEEVHERITAIQYEFKDICDDRRKEANVMEMRVNGRLEEVFNAEDTRIQNVVKIVKENIDSKDPQGSEEADKEGESSSSQEAEVFAHCRGFVR